MSTNIVILVEATDTDDPIEAVVALRKLMESNGFRVSTAQANQPLYVQPHGWKLALVQKGHLDARGPVKS